MDLAAEFVGISEARRELPDRVSKLASGEVDRVVILKYASPVAVILTPEEYDRMRALEATRESIEDLFAILKARETDDGSRTTLDEIREQFGIE